MRTSSCRLTPVLFCVCVVTFANPVSAQDRRGSVTGTVTGSGAPLPAAKVSIKGTPFSASTDADGNYRIPAVPPGRYTISFSSPAFKTAEIPIEIQAAQSVNVNADLEVSSAMETVTITVSLDAGETEKLNVSASTGTLDQSINGVPSPRIFLDDRDELSQEAIREAYRRAVLGTSLVIVDGRSAKFFVNAGVTVGSQDLTIVRRNGSEILYSGRQLGGFAGAVFQTNPKSGNRWEHQVTYFYSTGKATRHPADTFTNATVTSAKHDLTVKRLEASAAYGYKAGPVTFSAGAELFFFNFKRSGTIQANSTTIPGATARIETDTRLERSGGRLVLGMEYTAPNGLTVTSLGKVGSQNWSLSLGVTRGF